MKRLPHIFHQLHFAIRDQRIGLHMFHNSLNDSSILPISANIIYDFFVGVIVNIFIVTH